MSRFKEAVGAKQILKRQQECVSVASFALRMSLTLTPLSLLRGAAAVFLIQASKTPISVPFWITMSGITGA